MTRKLFFSFIKDKTSFIFLYFANSIFLIVFFELSTNGRSEIIYPLFISLFFFILLLTNDWFKYKSFNESLIKSTVNPHIELQANTYEQTAVSDTIRAIHSGYLTSIDNLKLDLQNRKHFISQWIHNMKTPVSVIDLIIQKSLSENDNPEDAIKNIKMENEKLFNGLEQVLSYLRLEEFSTDYEPEVVDLAVLMKNVINNRKTQFIYSNVFPRFGTSPEKVLVLTDHKWNEILVDQILSNAIKYSFAEDKPKNIYINLKQDIAATILTIRDEGIGIPPYDLDRIFEPFFTGENGRKSRNSTGIGLYICSLIAEKLGHKIEIQSSEGYGTTVTISYLSKM
ncbi:MAG: sensor histidine kinase [Bacillota bacterium]|nr:sensor histidine kinase [Bacillota bacterium]